MKKNVIPAIALGAMIVVSNSKTASASNGILSTGSAHHVCQCLFCDCGGYAEQAYFLSLVCYYISSMVSDIKGISQGTIQEEDNLVRDLGMDSMDLLRLADEIEDFFHIEINTSALIEYGDEFTVRSLSEEILSIHIDTYPCTYGACR